MNPARVLVAIVCLMVGVGCSTAPVEPMAADEGEAELAAEATSRPARRATSRPTIENLTIDLESDLGELKARTVGVLRPGTSPNPPESLLAALRPLAGERPPLLVTLGDLVKYDGKFPGDKGWEKWEAGVAELVRKYQSEGRLVYWEVWNEPDQKSSFKGSQSAFFSVWVHTARVIRSLDAKAVLVGPSTSKYTWVQEFLKVGKEFDVLPDVVWWHEDTFRSEWRGHVTGASEAFWQDGTSREHLVVSQRTSNAHKFAPGDPVIYLAGIHKAHEENAFRGVREEFGFKLSHLVTKDAKPRAICWTYAAYAGMVGQQQMKVSGTRTIDAVATRAPDGTVTVLLGRNRGRSPTTLPSSAKLGDAFVVVKGLTGGVVRIRGRYLADTGDRAADAPRTTIDSVVPVVKGEAKVALPAIASGEACVLSITHAEAASGSSAP